MRKKINKAFASIVQKNSLSSAVLNSLDAFLPSPTLVEALILTSYKLYFSKNKI